MQNKKRFSLGDAGISIALIVLVVFGSLMIASAEMGNSVGDTSYLAGIIRKQIIYAAFGFVLYLVFMNVPLRKVPRIFFWVGYMVIIALLLSCKLFGETNGAYAWLYLPGGMSIQPSEFAKTFMIIFGARLLGTDHKDENKDNFFAYAICSFILFLIIAIYQHDFGSALVLFVICFCILFIPPYKDLRQYQIWMMWIIIGTVALVGVVLSPPVTEFLKRYKDNYMIGRFLAAADPFLYQYDNGYHLIMSLVSFANGDILGLGYGNSIHKYMNFPNPSNDFILPVIVEELGIVGFTLFIMFYVLLLGPIVIGSLRSKYISSKIVLLGTFVYFIVHFILNVGGVSGFVPLTGVPLLLISSGGSSLVSSMMALGLAQCELIRSRVPSSESNCGKVQENAD